MTDQQLAEHDPEVVRMLQSIAANKRECDALRGQLAQLTTDLANERALRQQLDEACQRIADERDFYMRQAVQLRTQLNNAATILMKDAEEAAKISYGHTERPNGTGMAARMAQLAQSLEASDAAQLRGNEFKTGWSEPATERN